MVDFFSLLTAFIVYRGCSNELWAQQVWSKAHHGCAAHKVKTLMSLSQTDHYNPQKDIVSRVAAYCSLGKIYMCISTDQFYIYVQLLCRTLPFNLFLFWIKKSPRLVMNWVKEFAVAQIRYRTLTSAQFIQSNHLLNHACNCNANATVGRYAELLSSRDRDRYAAIVG